MSSRSAVQGKRNRRSGEYDRVVNLALSCLRLLEAEKFRQLVGTVTDTEPWPAWLKGDGGIEWPGVEDHHVCRASYGQRFSAETV